MLDVASEYPDNEQQTPTLMYRPLAIVCLRILLEKGMNVFMGVTNELILIPNVNATTT